MRKLLILLVVQLVAIPPILQKHLVSVPTTTQHPSDTTPSRIFIRVFKYEKTLEVWGTDTGTYTLYKSYKICILSGGVGPKRREGDLQVPEGFYRIIEYNPHSEYHRSLKLDYPNSSDRILSLYQNLGGMIYIHGGCASVGCIAIGNKNIEELFNLALAARSKGQTDIPVHIFPINYGIDTSVDYLDTEIKKKKSIVNFEDNIKEGYYRFDTTKMVPKVDITPTGRYIFM